ncbi:MAG: hypothetical protein KatS3mg028_1115 [Bacteroidia bacterium]|nr:MAG: hypothetical protein KatS3mg028_1115 [Bacteroidia bacterium]
MVSFDGYYDSAYLCALCGEKKINHREHRGARREIGEDEDER